MKPHLSPSGAARTRLSLFCFPKDAAAGGTWIGVSEKKRLICLLNGGFTAHTREESYRLSRGVVVTQLLSAENFKETIAINYIVKCCCHF